jgi:hypothetical protein
LPQRDANASDSGERDDAIDGQSSDSGVNENLLLPRTNRHLVFGEQTDTRYKQEDRREEGADESFPGICPECMKGDVDVKEGDAKEEDGGGPVWSAAQQQFLIRERSSYGIRLIARHFAWRHKNSNADFPWERIVPRWPGGNVNLKSQI